MIIFIVVATFLSVTFCGIAMYFWYYRRFLSEGFRISKRLENVNDSLLGLSPDIPFVVRETEFSRIPFLNRLLEKTKLSRQLQKMLEQADLPPTVGPLLLMMIIWALIGVLLGARSQHVFIGVLAGLGLSLVPVFFVKMRITIRLRSFSRAFPDAIDMMIGALRAGHAFSKALQLVAMEAPEPVGGEFRKTFEEHNLGRPIKECLIHLSERVESSELKLFVTAVLLQRETGGNLTEILEKISYTIRERFKLAGQMQVYTAQGRLSAWVLSSLPIMFIVIISAINPSYLKPLFNEPVGRYMLLTGAVLQVIGVVAIRRIVRLKFD
jgi:tight adherence protein B